MHVLCVGDVQRQVDKIAKILRERGNEVTCGYGRKDKRALDLLEHPQRAELSAILVVIERGTDPDDEIRWQCWTHRAKGKLAVMWKYCDPI